MSYCGPKQNFLSRELSSTLNDPEVLNANLEKQIKKGKAAQVYNQGNYFINLSLGVVSKPNNK